MYLVMPVILDATLKYGHNVLERSSTLSQQPLQMHKVTVRPKFANHIEGKVTSRRLGLTKRHGFVS